MRILVTGATGGTGRLIVEELVRQGHSPVILARSPEKAAGLAAEIILGDARDELALSRAVDGCDAVISALGPSSISLFREVTLLSTATRALLKAMQEKHVRRLVCITGMGAGDSRGHGGLLFDWLIMPLALRKIYEDKDRQEALVRQSGLDWTLVRPSVLNNKPPRNAVRTLVDLGGFSGGAISRGDVARFVVAQLQSDEWLRKAPLITS
jgi:uncharacterized protein YbjT (DUF2867 family)